MSEVHLTASVRRNILTLDKMNKLLTRTTDRVTTNKKVIEPSDNPTSYFAAANLSWEAEHMDTRLDGMSESMQLINMADNGISGIRGYIVQMQGLVDDALANSNSDERRVMGQEFNTLITQIREMTADSKYNGRNLLYDNYTETVHLNNDGTSKVTLDGVNISTAKTDPGSNGEVGASLVQKSAILTNTSGVTSMAYSSYALTMDFGGENVIGVKSAGTDNGAHEIDWGSTDYAKLLTSLEGDLEKMTQGLKSESLLLASDMSLMVMRQGFTQKKQTIYENGANELLACDLNEESANLLSLKTSTSLGSKCLTSSSRMAQQALSILQS